VNRLQGKSFAILLACVGALLILGVNEAVYWQSRQSMDQLISQGTSRITILKLTENLINAESGQRGYVLSGNANLLRGTETLDGRIAESFNLLAREHAGQTVFVAALARARAKFETRLAVVRQAVALRRAGQQDEAILLAMQDMGTMAIIQSIDDELMTIEDDRRKEQRSKVYQNLMLARIALAAVTLLALLVLVVYLRQAGALGRHQQQLKSMAQDVRADLEVQVAVRTAELTDLMRYLLNTREDERSRLARDLHDELGSLLTSAKLDAARIKPRLGNTAPEALALLAHLASTLNSCVALGRNIIENLRPSALSNLGLVATLEIVAREFAETSGVKVDYDLEPVVLTAAAELTLYRVVQEALTNIAKYARASHVWIDLHVSDNEVRLMVRDDGGGFNTESIRSKPAAAYGLLGMRFRVESEGGALTVTSALGTGTQILATLKLPTSPV
jgi:signal transduction histidine kinase